MADSLDKRLLFCCLFFFALPTLILSETEISYEELTSEEKNFTIVDIRRRQELIDFGQIPESHVLPLQEIEESLDLSEEDFLAKYGFDKLSTNDSSLVFTCRSGRRVRVANDILKTHGFNIHRLYLGSFLDWNAHGGPLLKPGHPFQPELIDQPEVIV